MFVLIANSYDSAIVAIWELFEIFTTHRWNCRCQSCQINPPNAAGSKIEKYHSQFGQCYGGKFFSRPLIISSYLVRMIENSNLHITNSMAGRGIVWNAVGGVCLSCWYDTTLPCFDIQRHGVIHSLLLQRQESIIVATFSIVRNLESFNYFGFEVNRQFHDFGWQDFS